ncbi:DUF2065 domain-containing protein [Frigidibacter sp. ROC022]|uniref:DUF2065 domain-containing protein n=1 Tax=Frigidibacter sp. ROC022 TaxID=2971796 RepID=UPI0030838448
MILALGLVFVVEGLILALLPNRLDEMLRLIAEMSPDMRRTLGLLALATGVVLVWLARSAI